MLIPLHGVLFPWSLTSIEHSLPCLTDTNTKDLTENSLRVIFLVSSNSGLVEDRRKEQHERVEDFQGAM